MSNTNISDIFKEYGNEVDTTLRTLFSKTSQLEMYGHMEYFMGFKDEMLRPAVRYGGKRFRACLALMLADWYGNKKAGLPVAISIELFHNFILIHDDIVDEDTHRRGEKTVWHVFGTEHAINSGDAQSLLASMVLADAYKDGKITNPEVLSYIYEQYLKVTEGQYLDFVTTKAKLGDEIVTEDMYIDMVTKKTSDLVSAATKGAGLAARVNESESDSLHELGQHFGVAYQIYDDTVSIWGDEVLTGKKKYGDIFEKKKSLPILRAYEALSVEDRNELAHLYNRDEHIAKSDVVKIITLLDSVSMKETMQKEVEVRAQKAKKTVMELSLSEEKKNLLTDMIDGLLPIENIQ